SLVRVDAADAMQAPAVAPVAQTATTLPVLAVRATIPTLPAVAVHAVTPVLAQTKAVEPVHVQEFTDDDENSYAIVTGDSNNVMGSWHDGDSFNKVKGKLHGNCIWFERDGKSYVIDDPALVARAKEYFKPMEELGRQQGELGEEQGRLGEEQGRIGELQA